MPRRPAPLAAVFSDPHCMSDSVPGSKAVATPVPTADAFLRAVRASDLVRPDLMGAVEAAVAAWQGVDGPMPEACMRALVDAHLLTEWQIDMLRQGKSRGYFFLGKCKILRLLGKGGMGSVYLAEHTTLKSLVAVKVLPRRRDQTPEQQERFEAYVRRFEQEARAAAALCHPNIARPFDLDTSGGINHFIVMEYIDGVDLERRVKHDGPLPVREAADLIRQAALGLEHAHEQGLVHRDIKPANLMVDSRGQLKILDLGLVQVDSPEGTGEPSFTQDDRDKIMGTPDYMSPEQARRQRADARSDIYSLGCTFYYLLTREPPFERCTDATTGIERRKKRIEAHINTPAPNVLDVRTDVPAAIVGLILRMMEKSPDFRPQSAREVADSLAAWLAANPAPPTPDQRSETRRTPPRRSRGTRAAGQPSAPSAPSATPRREPSRGSAGNVRLDSSASGSGIHSGGLERSGSDIHGMSHVETLRTSSTSHSTGRSAAEAGGRQPAAGGEAAIVIDTAAAPSKTATAARRGPPAAAGSRATTVPTKRQGIATALAPWSLRRVAGLPLAAWLIITAAVVAAAITAAVWWFASVPADEEEEEAEAALPVAASSARDRTTGSPPPKPRPQKPAAKPGRASRD